MKTTLTEKTPGEIIAYITNGGLLDDTPETAGKLITTMLPLRGPHYEIVFLGNEVCVRTRCRGFEAMRLPLTIGGVFLLMTNLEASIARCMMWIAKGGDDGF